LLSFSIKLVQFASMSFAAPSVLGVAVHDEAGRLVLLAQRVVEHGLFGVRMCHNVAAQLVQNGLPLLGIGF
jgi:hypothetical protein